MAEASPHFRFRPFRVSSVYLCKCKSGPLIIELVNSLTVPPSSHSPSTRILSSLSSDLDALEGEEEEWLSLTDKMATSRCVGARSVGIYYLKKQYLKSNICCLLSLGGSLCWIDIEIIVSEEEDWECDNPVRRTMCHKKEYDNKKLLGHPLLGSASRVFPHGRHNHTNPLGYSAYSFRLTPVFFFVRPRVLPIKR